VIYEIYPQSFTEVGGDGIGDLRGITRHPGNLKRLGVTVIWFSPSSSHRFRGADEHQERSARVPDLAASERHP
jgi:hypothetical protein